MLRALGGAAVALLAVLVSLPAAGEDAAPAASTGSPGSPTPVVLLVLDGLPESALLDRDGAVDAVRHPNFAALAATSTRFTAVTTVAVRTTDSLPALLSGRRPGETRRLPIAEEHDDTLFRLVDDYEKNVVDTESVLLDVGRGLPVNV